MGLGLGGLVDEHVRLRRRPDVPRLRRARPDGRERGAARGRRVVVAGARGREVDALLPRHGRDADRGAATCSAGSSLWIAIRSDDRRDRVPRSSPRCSARCRRRGVCSRSPSPALTAAAFCAPLAAFSVTQETDFVVPGDHAARDPAAVPVLGHVLPDRRSCRTGSNRSRASRRCGTASSSRGRRRPATSSRSPIARATSRCSSRVVAAGWYAGTAHLRAAVDADDRHPSRGARRVVERNVLAYRRMWFVFLTGFAEPVLFLLSIGVGVGELVGDLQVGGHIGRATTSSSRPGLLAMSAMYGRAARRDLQLLREVQVHDTPTTRCSRRRSAPATSRSARSLWSLLRGAIYSTVFLLTMLRVRARRARGGRVLAAPVAVLIGFAFAGAGLAATTFMRSFLDFDYVNLAIVPLFLFSATFFPLSQYPGGPRGDHPRHAAVPRRRAGAVARARRRALDAAPQRRVSRW